MAPANKLTAMGFRQAKPGAKVRKLADGGGLFLQLEPSGSRLWRLAYRFGGKQKTISLGALPIVGLAEARAARDDAKALLLQGIDPSAARKAAKAEAAAEAAPADVLPTWDEVALEYLRKMQAEGPCPADCRQGNVAFGPRGTDLGRPPDCRDYRARGVGGAAPGGSRRQARDGRHHARLVRPGVFVTASPPAAASATWPLICAVP